MKLLLYLFTFLCILTLTPYSNAQCEGGLKRLQIGVNDEVKRNDTLVVMGFGKKDSLLLTVDCDSMEFIIDFRGRRAHVQRYQIDSVIQEGRYMICHLNGKFVSPPVLHKGTFIARVDKKRPRVIFEIPDGRSVELMSNHELTERLNRKD